MFKSLLSAALGAAAVALAGPVSGQGLPTGPQADGAQLILVSGGCGPNGWRGHWGHCHYRGRRYWGGRLAGRCPPGYWRGPWGHCRNTPYHGRLPGGGYKP
jgi:hypothetical protein